MKISLRSSMVLACGLMLGAQSIAFYPLENSTNTDEVAECELVFNQIARCYLEDNQELLSIYRDTAKLVNETFDIASLKYVDSVNLDQGVTNLRREVWFIDDAGNQLVLYTMGDFSCAHERVLGIAKITKANTEKSAPMYALSDLENFLNKRDIRTEVNQVGSRSLEN